MMCRSSETEKLLVPREVQSRRQLLAKQAIAFSRVASFGLTTIDCWFRKSPAACGAQADRVVWAGNEHCSFTCQSTTCSQLIIQSGGTSVENLSPQSTSSGCVPKVGFANQNAHASSTSRTKFGKPIGNSGNYAFAA
jgi:hypothetical protein